MNILFINKVEILVLIKWSYIYIYNLFIYPLNYVDYLA